MLRPASCHHDPRRMKFINFIRRIFWVFSWVIVVLLKPVKIYAYRTRFSLVRRLILVVTMHIDFMLIFLNIQNETMELHWKIYRGNFIFGNGVMVTDFDSAAQAIVQPLYKNSDFMGVKIVSSDNGAFATNCPILLQSPPIRKLTRQYIDDHIFTPVVQDLGLEAVREQCREILEDWSASPKMAKMLAIRSTVTRIFLKLLSGTTISQADSDFVTFQYIRRFVEMSLFSGYFPAMCIALGTGKFVHKDAYYKLRAYGIDNMTIDMTLFAALFSIGTLVIRCVENVTRYNVDFAALTAEEKRNFVIESVRLYPTVTSVHRLVEGDETVHVAGKPLHLTAGDEIVYPFICANQDPRHFPNPAELNLHRTEEEYEKVLSWSKGSHVCPAKKLSVVVTTVMLETLAEKFSLEELHIFNPAF
jgi:hypothetical protein